MRLEFATEAATQRPRTPTLAHSVSIRFLIVLPPQAQSIAAAEMSPGERSEPILTQAAGAEKQSIRGQKLLYSADRFSRTTGNGGVEKEETFPARKGVWL